MPTRSYLSQSELPVTFGLGKLAKIDEVEVLWPGGPSEKLPIPALDTTVTVKQN